MKKHKANQNDTRWIFPKEKKGIYSDAMLRYFIAEAETKLQETVAALSTIRDRYYTVLNILLVAIGTISAILFTCPGLASGQKLFLTVLLIYMCLVCSTVFIHLKYYIQYGPGFKPRNIDGLENWMRYYHEDTSDTSCLYSILETKQEMMDLNDKEADRQLSFLRIITVAIALALLATVVMLTVSAILS